MTQAIAISGLGMISCLASGAKENAAAMRCGYSNFLPTEFYVDNTLEQQLGATAINSKFVGIEHLVEMAQESIKQAISGTRLNLSDIPIIVVFPTEKETPSSWPSDFYNVFFKQLQSQFPETRLNVDSAFERSGKVGLVKAFRYVQNRLYDKHYAHTLILAVDSLLNNYRIALYQDYNTLQRLLCDDVSDGFIPGEAAVAILFSKPNGTEQTCITGIGLGKETAVIDSDNVLKATGLSEATRNAAKDAGIRVCDTNFIISSVSGESYYFKELSLTQIKTLEQKIESYPLWHPSDNIGEVGAAVGGALIVMGHYAFESRYSPGKSALCLLSNDDADRGAFILEQVDGKMNTK